MVSRFFILDGFNVLDVKSSVKCVFETHLKEDFKVVRHYSNINYICPVYRFYTRR